jgi:5-oxoprolinase (ATP-hydrolysing) subunit A
MAPPRSINLNADLGESFGAWQMGSDDSLLAVVASANIACGAHAGDPTVMRHTVRQALARGVSLGAHPSFPDLQGFGRRRMAFSADEIEALVLYQVGALQAMATAEGGRISHVKPHGALNNIACVEAGVADAIARAVHALDRSLILLAPALSELAAAGRRAGLPVALEAFADRAYQDDGQLVPRSQPGAMVHGAAASLAHVQRMLDAGGLVTLSGKRLATPIDSICLHGDGPEAVASAQAVRLGLIAAGWQVCPLTAMRLVESG